MQIAMCFDDETLAIHAWCQYKCKWLHKYENACSQCSKGNDDNTQKANGFRAFNIKHPPRGKLGNNGNAAETEN